MQFVRVDAYEGRSKEQVKSLLDAVRRAVLSAFGVPLRDAIPSRANSSRSISNVPTNKRRAIQWPYAAPRQLPASQA
jgi:hypothetical protein